VNLTITFPAHLLPLLVPDGGSLDSTWVVCFAHRPTVEANGIPALGGTDGWHPMIPCETEDAATRWAEKFTRATLHEEPEQLTWHAPEDDPQSDARELWVEFDDGTEHSADIAIIPLTMLAKDGDR
jgi:hypothetical protein